MNTQQTPILYSLQNCPYAIRARLALFKSQKKVLLRAIKLNNKPSEMLSASAKGSVPILVISQNLTIDESLDIMLWSLDKKDPNNLLHCNTLNARNNMLDLIKQFETHFIPALSAYACAKRYHNVNLIECRILCETVLQQLETRLSQHTFLYSNNESLFDIAIVPFIRKFSKIERKWYQQSPYPNLRNWLNNYLQSTTFTKVMAKHELWIDSGKQYYFPSP